MSTLVTLTPSTVAAPSFQPTLNGQQYSCTVLWNIFGQRYYINLSDLQGNLILYTALVSSGPVLQATLDWETQTATATTTYNHNVPVGSLASILVSDTDSAYDGFWEGLSTGPATLTYTLATNPNQPTPLQCQLEFPLNLVAGYLSDCYLFFYDATNQFEYSG